MAAPLIDQAIGHIQDLISHGALAPGSRLPPEQQLSEMLGCSRSTTREAVRALVMARVLDVRRGDGTYVTSLEPGLLLEGLGFAADLMRDESLLELFEIRMLLEPAATAKAAEKISDAHLDELAAILEQMHRCTDDDSDLVQHDAKFHASSGSMTCPPDSRTAMLTGTCQAGDTLLPNPGCSSNPPLCSWKKRRHADRRPA